MLILDSEILSVCVFFWLIFSLNCGVFFSLFGCMCINRLGCFVIIFRSWLCVFVNVLWLSFFWLISLKLKFVVVFNLIIVGMLKGNINLLWIWLKVCVVLVIMVLMLFFLLLCFFQGLRLINVIFEFCFWLLKLKLFMVNMFLMFVFLLFR